MKILTFDTSLNKTYLTYGEDEKILENREITSTDEKYHSVSLVPEIIDIFKKYDIKFQDIDVIGINEGPGSFTGIRICTVIARVAAQQADIKVVPVPSLEILSRINKTDKKSLVLLDARKHKSYAAIYGKNGEEIKTPDIVVYEEAAELCKSDDFEIITDSSMKKILSENGINAIDYEAEDYPLGEYLYRATLEKLSSDNDYFWAKAKPLYIQPPSITMPKKAGN
ncbi:MAG: tRNA (adenosine(37)-N6)-threonylcarbamoyltransferase complex dimerization subunit type 1 TsaB [Candidatus Gastranaerophilales bacterium]|nr:tRNA (adenosine(37)-N6)-threonylcarbamoyltransferase complex dimerization subunit type 1 TsaB [Candidatus Gastranaerophilales bacterium]